MLKIILLIIISSGILFSETVEIKGYLTIWEKTNSQAIPKPIIKNIPVKETISIPENPQTFDLKKFIYISTQTYNLYIEILFFSIYPTEGIPYFASQIQVSGNINLICGGYFNKNDFIPFPVLYCSQKIDREKYIGITLHRKNYLSDSL